MSNKASWVAQYPRRKASKDIITVHDQLHQAAEAVHTAEYEQGKTTPTSMDAVLERFGVIQEAISQLQEAADMYCDLFRFDKNQAKAGYIKANADSFIDPTSFLDNED